MEKCECNKCGWKWTPRKPTEEGLPVACPNCTSRRWNVKKKDKKKGGGK